jgi:thiol:disulfide interchange protein
MRRLFTLLAFFSTLSLVAQKPVTWSTTTRTIDEQTAELIITATIEAGWHLYSQDIPEGGPIPTSFVFNESEQYSLSGPVGEEKAHEEFDPNFDMILKYFEKKADFVQRIKVNSTEDFEVKGELEFMVCNDEMCLPPEYVDIAFKVKGATTAPVSQTNETQEEPKEAVTWSTSTQVLNDTITELIITAEIGEGWHLYSQDIPEGGPIPTSFTFKESDSFSSIGSVKEAGNLHEEYDPLFEMELKYFDTKAVFTQQIAVRTVEDFTLSGELEFMVCNDEMCLPPEFVDLSFDVPGAKNASIAQSNQTIAEESKDAKQTVNMTLVAIFIEGFIFGWLALFMPCIFPMIPLTVSFFTKQSKTKREGVFKAAIYGLSIILIYVVLGLVTTYFFGSSFLNELATNPWFNIFFFVLFVVFAISFFGAFEITLPSSWVNKADEASNKGGFIGIFFMAFTLALVSFSCTGPLIGTLLVDAGTKGELLGPTVGMFAFSFALAMPFTLFAAFPGWLNSMPKSGGWLNNVKVSLGFLELAFAFKFLSTADMVLQAHFLERELFFAIWVGIDFLLVLYLLGVYITPNDSPVDRIGVSRLSFAILFTVFGFYLLPGIWGAPVKIVAGFPPPEHYAESKGGAFASHGGGGTGEEGVVDAKFGDHCPFDLNCFNDFEAGVAYAKEVGKPIMIDFTGWGCVNCRKMEEYVWTDPRVLSRLRENVVLISLYVDERTKLPEAEQGISEKTGRKIKNVGNKWSEFQEVNFGAVAQPYYVFLGHESLEPLHESAAYDPDIEKFIDWLDRGVEAFEAAQ